MQDHEPKPTVHQTGPHSRIDSKPAQSAHVIHFQKNYSPHPSSVTRAQMGARSRCSLHSRPGQRQPSVLVHRRCGLLVLPPVVNAVGQEFAHCPSMASICLSFRHSKSFQQCLRITVLQVFLSLAVNFIVAVHL